MACLSCFHDRPFKSAVTFSLKRGFAYSKMLSMLASWDGLAHTVSLVPSEWKALAKCKIAIVIFFINEGLLLATWELTLPRIGA